MKLLLDECMPRGLMATFPEDCEVKTVRGIGWSGTKNGVLLQRAAEAGFDQNARQTPSFRAGKDSASSFALGHKE